MHGGDYMRILYECDEKAQLKWKKYEDIGLGHSLIFCFN